MLWLWIKRGRSEARLSRLLGLKRALLCLPVAFILTVLRSLRQAKHTRSRLLKHVRACLTEGLRSRLVVIGAER